MCICAIQEHKTVVGSLQGLECRRQCMLRTWTHRGVAHRHEGPLAVLPHRRQHTGDLRVEQQRHGLAGLVPCHSGTLCWLCCAAQVLLPQHLACMWSSA